MIDLEKDKLFGEFALQTLRDRYMIPEERSPQEALWRASKAFADDDEHAQRLYKYVSNQWFMFATPLLSNGGTNRGMPISCFLNYVDDSREGITDVFTEDAFLSSAGGGIGTYWGHVRSKGTKTSRGSESTGVVPFIKVSDSLMLAFSQGVTRRGSNAAYLDISHPEIEEFLDIRKPTGDANRACLNIHHGVILSDKFMRIISKAMKDRSFNDSWDLIDPHTNEVTKTVSAKALWIKIIQNRHETGEPYIMWSDTVNDELPDFQRMLGLKVNQSNLCSEITLPTDQDRTAVCCLSSVNLEKFDEWSIDPNFIADLIRMLDNTLQVFIDTAPESLYKAIYSAHRERSIGLGAMGFHAYLQSKGIPFESEIARRVNKTMFEYIKNEAVKETTRLAEERGPCPDAKGRKMVRNAHLLAIAPNASSSILCGNTSPGIEPYRANVFVQKTLTGSHTFKNQYLQEVLKSYQMDNDEVWSSIMANRGSIQHLDIPDHIKQVFKTAIEIDQRWVITHAADRTPFICQSQSVNLFFPSNVTKKELHETHMMAWEAGVKTLYYLRSEAFKRSDNLSQKMERAVFNFDSTVQEEDDCLACEG
jgi:ribonucleoside-diphosphate reductase alpha chain